MSPDPPRHVRIVLARVIDTEPLPRTGRARAGRLLDRRLALHDRGLAGEALAVGSGRLGPAHGGAERPELQRGRRAQRRSLVDDGGGPLLERESVPARELLEGARHSARADAGGDGDSKGVLGAVLVALGKLLPSATERSVFISVASSSAIIG